jgi:hypothetical protein
VQKTEATATVVDPATTAAAAKKEAEAATARKAELELNFRSGNITAAEYIEQSGAMSEYLASQGVPLDQLKQVVEQTQMNSEAQSWADAVEDFKNSPAGNDWPGGDGNLVTLNDKLLSLGLEDSTDRVGALTRAYAAMRKAGQVIPYTPPAEEPTNTAEEVADGASRRALADKLANDAAAAAAALKAKPLAARTSSSLFGASSGVSDIPTTTTTKAGATIEIPREVSPAEIIDAWKKAVVAQGGSPNDEFKSAFAGKAR